MLSFNYTEEQRMLIDTARKFVEKDILPKVEHYDETEEYPRGLVEKAFELGFLNPMIPEKFGGFEMSLLDNVIVMEEICYGCSGIGLAIGINDLALKPLIVGVTEEQGNKFLKPFTEKPTLAAFCLTEPNAGSDASAIKTTFKKDGDNYIVNGSKSFITAGVYADYYTVFGTVDTSLKLKGVTVLFIPKNLPGVTVTKKEKKMGQRCSDTAAISFEDVKVPVENRIGEEGEGFKIAMKTLNFSRPIIGAMAVGIAKRAVDLSVNYSKERVQFGKPIAANQGISFMLADMATQTDAARLLVHRAAWNVDNQTPNPKFSSMAKYYASDIAMQVCTDAVQIFGGYGYSREYPVEKLMRDVKVTQIYEGTNQVQRIVVAKELLGKL